MFTDFAHPLFCQRTFKFPSHLEQGLGIDKKIAMSDINIPSAILQIDTDADTARDMDKDADTTRTETHTLKQKRTWNWLIAPTDSYGAMISSAASIAYGKSQQRSSLLMPLPDENNGIQIFIRSAFRFS